MKYGIKPVVTALKFEELLEDFFESIFKISESKKVLIAIDEFQEISSIKNKKIDALLIKYIQDKRSKNISYIFLGSKRHLLTSLFEYKSSIFELAIPLELTTLDINDIYKYLKVDEEIIKYVFDLCDGETKLMQSAISSLMNREILDKNDEASFIPDRTFELWGKRIYI